MDTTFEEVYDTWVYCFSYEFKLINPEKLIYQFIYTEKSATTSINKYILLSTESKNKLIKIYKELKEKIDSDWLNDIEEITLQDEIFNNGSLIISVPRDFMRHFLSMLVNFINMCNSQPESVCCKKEFYTVIDPT